LKPRDLHIKVLSSKALSSSQAKQTLYFSWVPKKTEAHKTQALLQTTRLLLHITQKQKQSFPESQLLKQNKNKANFTHKKSSN
jgi:hypothetical protein